MENYVHDQDGEIYEMQQRNLSHWAFADDSVTVVAKHANGEEVGLDTGDEPLNHSSYLPNAQCKD